MTTSGFTFIHNAIDSGYPIVEAIRAVRPYVDEVCVVDMQSTDNTRQVLEKLSVKIIDGYWGNQAGHTLRQAHNQYRQCSGDIIVHFEADEVYDDRLIKYIAELIKYDHTDISVHRLQLEQNFQRCRWYPEPVHRVFPRLSHTRKEGHTTDRHHQAIILGPEDGYLWDITNCFRDNWVNRVKKQAELWNKKEVQYIMTPIHSCLSADISDREAQHWLYSGRHWAWKETPFNIPDILRPLVGMVKYEPKI
jgi:glycosyltransferase involved in cell wall biosynthesis